MVVSVSSRTVAHMSRTRIMLPIVVCLLALTAGCASKSGVSGAGALQPVASPSRTAATPTTPATGRTTSKTSTPPSSFPVNGDCVSYNPNNLTVDGSGVSGTFLVENGSTVVIRVHGQSDDVGQEALALAQRYTKHCYVGRDNNMDPKGDFIFDYWRDPSGQTPAIPNEDDLCSPYNNKNLTVEDMGEGQGWRVKDHDHVLHVFADQTDANNGDLVLKKYSQVCTIGDLTDSDSDLGQVDYQR